MAGALSRIKVLDFTQVYSGPFLYIVIERPGRRDYQNRKNRNRRCSQKRCSAYGGPGKRHLYYFKRGKKSITLDIRTEKGRKICKDLVKKVDILVEILARAPWTNSV